ncbi:MAG: sulfite exporter TauE/SafE family protein [Bdellovibrionales bacterium]|nr:sulfite exporter TauE/SafE family protein [Bdellovibrionales bacterium]
MEFLGYVSSVLMGMVLGLIGGGGSILTVPILVYLFAQTPTLATGSSLFVVGSTAFAGAMSFIKAGTVRVKESLLFAVPSIVGVLGARKIIFPLIPQRIFLFDDVVLSKDILLMILFAALMLIASLKMLRAPGATQERGQDLNVFQLVSQGLFVGLVTGFIGAGGGFLIVPALVFVLGFRMQEAIGTSLLIIAGNSLIGFLVTMEEIEGLRWSILLPVTLLAIAGMFLGKRFQGSFSEAQLKKSFGIFVLLIGSFILADQVVRMIS